MAADTATERDLGVFLLMADPGPRDDPAALRSVNMGFILLTIMGDDRVRVGVEPRFWLNSLTFDWSNEERTDGVATVNILTPEEIFEDERILLAIDTWDFDLRALCLCSFSRAFATINRQQQRIKSSKIITIAKMSPRSARIKMITKVEIQK